MKSMRVPPGVVVLAWALLALVVLFRFTFHPERTIKAYRIASLAWIAGEPLYDGTNQGFLYAPQAAVLYLPFALLPDFEGNILWRLVNLAIFVFGIYRFGQLLGGPEEKNRAFAVISFFALPLAYGSAVNGQFNLIMGGLMLLTVTEVARAHWWRAAFTILLAVAIKPLAAVLFLLLIPLYPALIRPSLAVLPAILAFPFLAQSPEYVATQYRDFVRELPAMSSFGDVRLYAHIFSTLTVIGLDVPHVLRNAVRVLIAGLTLLACYRVQRRLSAPETAFYLYALASAYVLVFNPRSEGVTYAILGPALGIWCFLHLRPGTDSRPRRVSVLVGGMLLLLGINYELSRMLFPGQPPVIFTPLVGVAFLAAVGGEAFTRTGRQRTDEVSAAPATPSPHRPGDRVPPPDADRGHSSAA